MGQTKRKKALLAHSLKNGKYNRRVQAQRQQHQCGSLSSVGNTESTGNKRGGRRSPVHSPARSPARSPTPVESVYKVYSLGDTSIETKDANRGRTRSPVQGH